MTAKTGFWQALESVPALSAVEAEWRARLGEDCAAAGPFLRPNGKRACSYPCARRGCGWAYDVVEHGPEDIVAVSGWECGCPNFALKPADVAVYELHGAGMGQALAEVFDLAQEPGSETGLFQTWRIGAYSPCAGSRFPVYLTIQVEPDDFVRVVHDLVSRTDTPLVLLAPTRDLCPPRLERLLSGRRSAFVPLSEEVVVGGDGKLRLRRPRDHILSPLRAASLPSPREEGPMVFFPTPPEATWSDVAIRFTDGHTVSVQAKAKRRVCNYTQMGMANRKNGEPTVQWALLRAFAEERGVIAWDSRRAHRRNQKRREILARNLRDFFHIEGDPFRLTEDGIGWEARFRISPDDF